MRRIKVPFELIFMVNVALRFIPDIKDKASEVMLAQTARGLELEKGNIITRAKNFLPLLTPLLVNYLLMARNSAVAIETRAFRWKNQRTYMRSMQLTPVDYLVIVLAVGLTVLCAAVFWRYGAELKIL
jgi:energy-coupling factor transport system permease protein